MPKSLELTTMKGSKSLRAWFIKNEFVVHLNYCIMIFFTLLLFSHLSI